MTDDFTAPDFRKAALINIDMQNDFCLPGHPAYVSGAELVTPAIVRLVDLFRKRGRLLVNVVRLYAPDGSNADLCRRASIRAGTPMVAPGTEGARLVEGIESGPLDVKTLCRGLFQAAGPAEFIVYKPRWGAFYGTRLEEFLRDRDVNTVIFSGVNFPNCVRASMYEASERDFRVVAASDCLIGAYPYGLEEMARLGMAVMSLAEIEAALPGA